MKKLYLVVRRHDGDKPYFPGETRELTPADAKHLIPLCLQEIKVEPEHSNKQAPAVKNKAARAND